MFGKVHTYRYKYIDNSRTSQNANKKRLCNTVN